MHQARGMRSFQRFRHAQQYRRPFAPRAAAQATRITTRHIFLHEAYLCTIANHTFGAHYSWMLQCCGQRSFAFEAGYRQLR